MGRHAIGVTLPGIEQRDEMIMRSAWRSRTTPGRLEVTTTVTTLVVAAVGFGLMSLAMAVLDAVGAPSLVRAAPWYLPTTAALVWALRRPEPAVVSEDGADSWLVFSLRATMVGVGTARGRPARVIAAVLLGALIAWGLLLVGVLALAGVG
jgi:hypothetical protein